MYIRKSVQLLEERYGCSKIHPVFRRTVQLSEILLWFSGNRVSSVPRAACALLTFTKALFVGAVAPLRVACVCAFARSDHFAVAILLLYDGSVVIPIT